LYQSVGATLYSGLVHAVIHLKEE